jgi:hypothetical protein
MAGTMFNEDDSHFAYELDVLLDGAEPTPSRVAAFVDRYADTSVRELLLCVNAQRTGFATTADGWEPIWEELETGPAWWRDWPWPKNGKRLVDAGIDRFALQLARCREIGIAPWLSIRTNDFHAVDDLDSPMHSWFWKQHHEYWRKPEHFERPPDRALNYAIPAVRERLLALVRDVSERYDFDGLEIDWMRTEFCVPPGREHADAPLITGLMADIRAVLDAKAAASGRPVALATRVPSRPRYSIGFGLDAPDWARQGLIDRIVPAPHIHLDFDIPVAEWRQLTADTGVLICPGLDIRIQPYPGAPRRTADGFVNGSSETARGAAIAYLHQGADRIYLFNHFCNGTNLCDNTPEGYVQLMREMGDLEALRRRPRRHLVTHVDAVPPGMAAEHALPAACGPVTLPPEALSTSARRETADFRLWTGPVPTAGQHVQLRLAFNEQAPAFAESANVQINGAPAVFAGSADADLEPGPAQLLWCYDVPATALLAGPNMVEVRTNDSGQVLWVEIAIG